MELNRIISGWRAYKASILDVRGVRKRIGDTVVLILGLAGSSRTFQSPRSRVACLKRVCCSGSFCVCIAANAGASSLGIGPISPRLACAERAMNREHAASLDGGKKADSTRHTFLYLHVARIS